MKRLGSILLSLALLFAGSAAVAPSASALPYINGCRGTHNSGMYHNEISKRTIESAAGTYGRWVKTTWKVSNGITGNVYYQNTQRRCVNVPGWF